MHLNQLLPSVHLCIVFQKALQDGFLKHLGDVVTVLLDLVCLSLFLLFVIPDRLDDDKFRSLCGALAVFRLFVQTKISLDYYNYWQN